MLSGRTPSYCGSLTFDAAAASIAPDGTVLLWSERQPQLLVSTSDSSWIIPLAREGRAVGAAINSSSHIELFDASTMVVAELTLGGRAIKQRQVAIPLREIDRAVYASGTWYVAGRDSSGDYMVVASEAQGMRRLFALAHGVSEEGDLSAHMSLSSRGLILSFVGPPFKLIELDWQGRVLSSSTPSPDIFAAADRSLAQDALWVAQPAFRIRNGILRQYADLRSDTRLIAIRTSRHAPDRSSLIDTPLGFVAAVPKLQQLVALRSAGSPSLVFYKVIESGTPLASR